MDHEDSNGRELDIQKTEEFIKTHPESKILFEQTKYVVYEEFKSKLLQATNIFMSQNNNQFYLLLCSHSKIGSEHWLTLLVWKLIRNQCLGIIDPCTDSPEENSHLLIIDDCIYSGCNIASTIDDFTFRISSKFPIHIIVPFISYQG